MRKTCLTIPRNSSLLWFIVFVSVHTTELSMLFAGSFLIGASYGIQQVEAENLHLRIQSVGHRIDEIQHEMAHAGSHWTTAGSSSLHEIDYLEL